MSREKLTPNIKLKITTKLIMRKVKYDKTNPISTHQMGGNSKKDVKI